MKKIFIFLFVIIFAVLLCSCSDNEIELSTPVACKSSSNAVIYDDIIYLAGDLVIEYVDIKKSTDRMVMCSDSLCSHNSEECPAYIESASGFISFLIDQNASDKNGGYPVFYAIRYKRILGDEITYDIEILRYDTKNNSREVLETTKNDIKQLWIYKNVLYYTTADGDDGRNIRALNVDTKEKFSLDNSEKKIFDINGFDEQNIYYTDYDGNIYFSPLDLSSKTFITESFSGGEAFVCSDKIYFSANLHVGQHVEGMDFLACDIYSLDKADLTAEPELVVSNVSYIDIPVFFQYENTFFYAKCENISVIGTRKYTDLDGNEVVDNVYSDGTNYIYLYDAVTNKSERFITNSDYQFGRLFSISDEYLMFMGMKYGEGDRAEEDMELELLVYNYVDGGTWEID